MIREWNAGMPVAYRGRAIEPLHRRGWVQAIAWAALFAVLVIEGLMFMAIGVGQ